MHTKLHFCEIEVNPMVCQKLQFSASWNEKDIQSRWLNIFSGSAGMYKCNVYCLTYASYCRFRLCEKLSQVRR